MFPWQYLSCWFYYSILYAILVNSSDLSFHMNIGLLLTCLQYTFTRSIFNPPIHLFWPVRLVLDRGIRVPLMNRMMIVKPSATRALCTCFFLDPRGMRCPMNSLFGLTNFFCTLLCIDDRNERTEPDFLILPPLASLPWEEPKFLFLDKFWWNLVLDSFLTL